MGALADIGPVPWLVSVNDREIATGTGVGPSGRTLSGGRFDRLAGLFLPATSPLGFSLATDTG